MDRSEVKECSPSMGDEVLDEREVQGIFGLRRRGWQVKAIARELCISRNTVRAWVRRGEGAPRPETGRPRVLGKHEAWVRERYLAGVRNGDVLRQELAERGVDVSLRTVERCIKPIREQAADLDRASVRFETAPGKQMQIDFGEKWVDIAGERRRRLSLSPPWGTRDGASCGCLLGCGSATGWRGWMRRCGTLAGCPDVCLVDNARALVLRWEGDHAVFHPEFDAFCRHWGMTPRACRPYRARTKGKVERSVGYGKSNGLGRLSFVSWEALDAHLVWWMREVADIRIHGTTHERPIDRFAREAAALRPIGDAPHLSPRAAVRSSGHRGLPDRAGHQSVQRAVPPGGAHGGGAARGGRAHGEVPGRGRRDACGGDRAARHRRGPGSPRRSSAAGRGPDRCTVSWRDRLEDYQAAIGGASW